MYNNGNTSKNVARPSVATICDQKEYDVGGGTFTLGAWRTRDINTEISDIDDIVSISSNQFTLQAGTYTIDWSAPAFTVDDHASRLYNVTDGTVQQYGTAVFSNDGASYATSTSKGSDTFTIASAKVFEVQHRSSKTSSAPNGFGRALSTDSTAVSIFTIVKIHKHA
jgi:hypothetical protein